MARPIGGAVDVTSGPWGYDRTPVVLRDCWQTSAKQLHDGGIKGGKVQRHHRLIVVAGLRLEHCTALGW